MKLHANRLRTPFGSIPEWLFAAVLLALLTVVFWKVRIIDTAVNSNLTLRSIDLYVEHYPVMAYGFRSLREGHLPLWNPYQLCGEPFLALTYSGLFYPPNAIYLFFDVPAGTEIAFIFHMLFGALCVWWLLRDFGIGMAGALCSAVTFVWSGWSIHYSDSAELFAGLTWIPLTVLVVNRVFAARPLAWLGLIVTIACQMFLGTTEILLHALYIAALFAVPRLAGLFKRGNWQSALKQSSVALACVPLGILLSAIQFVPSLELVLQSVRAPGSLSFQEAIGMGFIAPMNFVQAALDGAGMTSAVTVGILPLVGTILVLGFRRYRLLWFCGVAATIGAASLVSNAAVYRFYYSLPMVGAFRNPIKFLDVFTFAQSVLVGVAVARLQSWTDLGRARLWAQPAWVAAVLAGVAALGWAAWMGSLNAYLVATLALFILFGISRVPRRRAAVVLGLCILQSANLFFWVGNPDMRPYQRPEDFTRSQDVFDFLRKHLGDDRFYISPALEFSFSPNLMARQAMLNRIPAVIDHEPVIVGRYEPFFQSLAGEPLSQPFAGGYHIGPKTRWQLMDLTGTRYFVVPRGDPADVFMAASAQSPSSPKFNLVYSSGAAQIYEKEQVLARAYFVPGARVLNQSAQVLATLSDPGFDPRGEVVLEGAPAHVAAAVPLGSTLASLVRITQYDPQQVTLAVTTSAPGFVILSDLFYPGWKAFIGNRELPMYRANYLFRAVRVEPGSWVIRFEYAPASLRLGFVLTTITALVVALLVAWTLWRRE